MIQVKQGDRRTVYYSVRDADTGELVDLTDTEVTMWARRLGHPSFQLPVVVVDAPNGRLELPLDGTLAAASYNLVVRMERFGQVSTVPTDGTDCLVVEATIGAVA
ncbi:tail fiber [Microbacterium phage Dewdrop]|nr:tail fiber [Microbacterium phage Leaf]QGZ17436.1 tail fiber [Microbacterium phage Dewdrop]